MFEQIMIGLLGTTAVWLSQDANAARRRWACIVGLCGQPFWVYAAWKAQQWGILLLSFVYAAGWLRGIYHHWVKHGR